MIHIDALTLTLLLFLFALIGGLVGSSITARDARWWRRPGRHGKRDRV